MTLSDHVASTPASHRPYAVAWKYDDASKSDDRGCGSGCRNNRDRLSMLLRAQVAGSNRASCSDAARAVVESGSRSASFRSSRFFHRAVVADSERDHARIEWEAGLGLPYRGFHHLPA